MPGRFRKSPASMARRTSQKGAVARAVGRAARRSATRTVRRATNPARSIKRAVRRGETRRRAQQVQSRPRPTVRPAGRPRRSIPRTPRPVRPGRTSGGVRRGGARPSQRPVPTAAQVLAGVAAGAVGALVFHAARAHPEVSEEAIALERDLEDLKESSTFDAVREDVANLDSTLDHMLALLESAREKGYRYQHDLEDLATRALTTWQGIRPTVLGEVETEGREFQSRLAPLSRQLQKLNASITDPGKATPLLQGTHAEVNDLLSQAQTIESRLEGEYGEIESLVYQVNGRLTQIHWALDQLAEAKFDLERGEDLVMAVPARWDQEQEDDPEGVLFLTNRRLILERKEKVAKKKVLFLTLASELVQEVSISEPLSRVTAVKAASKGLFGHQDYLIVSFSDPALADVSFHLDGQDSEDWARLVEDARSGKIEEDRVTGKGLSFQELTGPVTAAGVVALQTEVNELQDEVMLREVREELQELENEVHALERQLADLRGRGYAIEKHLEPDIAVLTAQWERIRERTEGTLNHQTALLGEKMADVQSSLATLVGMTEDLSQARPLYREIKSAIASLEAQADAAEDTVLMQYDEYAEEIESLSAHLEWVGWMLDALATASFQLLATESGVGAVEALWRRPNAEPENGVLFLTDQRLLWEDRVGDYELKVEAPLSSLEDVRAETTEAGEPLLDFRFTPQAPLSRARFALSLPVSDAWLKMVGRARAGDYVRDRAVEIDPAELERVKNAPASCPNCGAAFTAPVLRGQTELTCEYCGVVTRL